MRLLLDENCGSRALAAHLRSAGHEVETVVNLLGSGTNDEEILAYAVREKWIIVTKDADDFFSLLHGRSDHAGLFIIYQDHGRSQLSRDAIVNAITNIAKIYPDVSGIALTLNSFQWR